MAQRIDFVALSQTTFARTLRRDTANALDAEGYHGYKIRPVRMPVERARGRIFRALARVDQWLWSPQADSALGTVLGFAVLVLAILAFRNIFVR